MRFAGSHDNWRLYEYIVQHFLGSISPDCVYLQTEIVFLIGEEIFSCVGTSPIKAGFTEVSIVLILFLSAVDNIVMCW